MKYKTAKDTTDQLKRYNEMDDLIVFRKPFNRKIIFQLKDSTEKTMDMKDYRYISLSNHGFLFIQDNPYDIIPIHLNNVKEITII